MNLSLFRKPAPALALAVAFAWSSNTTPAAAPAQPTDLALSGTMAELTSPEVERAARDGAIVLLPVGVVEEHGPHLDLTPDIYVTVTVCRGAKARLEKLGTRTIIAPPYFWGINTATGSFAGSFTVKPETMKAVLADTIGCLRAWGFTRVFVVNGHGDPTHNRVLSDTVADIQTATGLSVHLTHQLNPRSYVPRPGHARPAGCYAPDYHAGAPETAMMLVVHPASVRRDIAKTLQPQPTFKPLGYAGNPAGYVAEDGQAFIEEWADDISARIHAFLLEQPALLP